MEDNGCHKVGRVVGMVVLGVITAVGLGLLLGYLVVLLWNWLMPSIFGLGTISYWQGFGLILLAKILFGGFGHGPGHPGRPRHPRHPRHFPGPKPPRCEDETWELKGGWKNWDYYDDWWRAEGKTAFETYIKKKRDDQGSEAEE